MFGTDWLVKIKKKSAEHLLDQHFIDQGRWLPTARMVASVLEGLGLTV